MDEGVTVGFTAGVLLYGAIVAVIPFILLSGYLTYLLCKFAIWAKIVNRPTINDYDSMKYQFPAFMLFMVILMGFAFLVRLFLPPLV